MGNNDNKKISQFISNLTKMKNNNNMNNINNKPNINKIVNKVNNKVNNNIGKRLNNTGRASVGNTGRASVGNTGRGNMKSNGILKSVKNKIKIEKPSLPSMPTVKSSKYSILSYILLGVLSAVLVVLVLYFANYYMSSCYEKKSFYQYLQDGDIRVPCVRKYEPNSGKDSTISRIIKREKEVFNISNQIYNSKQASCKCDAFGAELATEAQVIAAYNKGFDTRNLGWIKGGKALMPVQHKSWKNEFGDNPPPATHLFHKHGIKGGHYDPKLRLGVLCYGVKPKGQTPQPIKEPPKPKPPPPPPKVPFCKRPDNFNASHKIEDDTITPFNRSMWSQYD